MHSNDHSRTAMILFVFDFSFFFRISFLDRFLSSLRQIGKFSHVKLRSDDASSSIQVDNEIMIKKDEIYFYS